MRDFKTLTVWQKSHQLTLAIYRLTRTLPPDERIGLSDQMRRAASSVPANLAEGCGRDSEGDLARFIQIAMGSAAELEYHLLLARDLDYVKAEVHSQIHAELTEVRKMLHGFFRSVKPANPNS